MAERQRIDVDAALLARARGLARSRSVPVERVLEEALARYLQEQGDELLTGIGAAVRTLTMRPPGGLSDPGRGPMPDALLGRMASRFDHDEDEAMRVAVAEQHAHREELAARRRAEG